MARSPGTSATSVTRVSFAGPCSRPMSSHIRRQVITHSRTLCALIGLPFKHSYWILSIVSLSLQLVQIRLHTVRLLLVTQTKPHVYYFYSWSSLSAMSVNRSSHTRRTSVATSRLSTGRRDTSAQSVTRPLLMLGTYVAIAGLPMRANECAAQCVGTVLPTVQH